MVAVVESEYLQHRFLRLFKHFLKMLRDFLFFIFFLCLPKQCFSVQPLPLQQLSIHR